MQRMVSKYVKCPYYHNEDSLTMYCEGVKEDSTLLNSFRTTSDKNEFKMKHCCSMERHKQCPIAEFLYKKYDK